MLADSTQQLAVHGRASRYNVQMSSERRAAIEAKKAKLEQMREARKNRQIKPRTSGVSDTPPREIDRADLNRVLDDILGSSSGDGTPIRSASPALGQLASSGRFRMEGQIMWSNGGCCDASRRRLKTVQGNNSTISTRPCRCTTRNIRAPPKGASASLPTHSLILHQPRTIKYEKQIQTMQVETDEPDAVEEKIRQQVLMQQHLEAEKAAYEQALEEESKKLDQEIEDEVRELTEEERIAFLADPKVLDFIDDSTKIFHRVLNDRYNYMSDYTQGADTGGDDSEGRRVKRFPELTVASYNKNHAALNEPAGIVAVWNTHSVERPEFVFHSPSDVLSVLFSPFHSNLIFGGTYSGQILLWDNRSKHLPVLKTPLSAAGHTHPVYAMQMVGTQNAHNLITSSTDGTVCSWLVDMLAQPQVDLPCFFVRRLPTCCHYGLGFPNNETTTFWVGTEEGNVYQANRYDRAGAKAGLNQYDTYKGHAGPVMGLHFHPLAGPVDFSDLFLTCSVDWTVKLWRAKSLSKPSTAPHAIAPLYSFDEADDYVYDVKWHPQHPAMFGSVDGSGKFDLWNLNADTEVPAVSTSVGSGRAINKLQWNKDGRHAALGGSDGKLYVYDIGDMGTPRGGEVEWMELQKVVAGIGASERAYTYPHHPTTPIDIQLPMEDDIQYLGTRPPRLPALQPSPRPVSGVILRIHGNEQDEAQNVVLRKSESNVFTIGRRPGGAGSQPRVEMTGQRVLLQCAVVSRHHAKLVVSDSGQVFLSDLSHHGSWLNSRKLLPETPTPLTDGDTIVFGKSVGSNTGVVRPVTATVSFIYEPQTPLKPLVVPHFSGRYGVSSDSESDDSDGHSDAEEHAARPPWYSSDKDDTTADFFSNHMWIPEDFDDEIEDDDQLDDEDDDDSVDQERSSQYSRCGSSMDLSSSPEPQELSPQCMEPIIVGSWPRSRSSSPSIFSSSFPPIRLAPLLPPKPTAPPIVNEPASPRIAPEDDSEDDVVVVTDDKPGAKPVVVTEVSEDDEELKESVACLKADVEKLQAQRRKYRERFNENINVMNDKFSNLDKSIDDKTVEIKGLYQQLSDKVTESVLACNQAQAQIDVLQFDMLQQRMDVNDAEKQNRDAEEGADSRANAKALEELVAEMTELRDTVRKEMADELQTVRAAKEALKALTDETAIQTESLKRKRALEEEEAEGDVARVVVAAEPGPRRKRAKQVAKVVARTLTGTAIGAVACWSLLAFS
ncbi:WD-REPEATS-REGION domain-containing protein [Mycena kentingensis (nom. inval.)]|nr:WD-REPEATS-REGION domain-containing protein [Mycena kentingensis (nom. inval.)]